MRFRFCGGLDAPDWLLTEIAIVAKLSTKQITFFAEQVIKQLLGKDLAYDKLDKLAQVVKFTRSDVKAALAAVNYVLDHATRYNVERKILGTEMQQLGLHEDLTNAVLDVYFKKKDTKKLKTMIFAPPRTRCRQITRCSSKSFERRKAKRAAHHKCGS
mgnify:CR=1 FL=1